MVENAGILIPYGPSRVPPRHAEPRGERGCRPTGGAVSEQLVVPRGYVSKVLFMAHTHLLGAHLGMEKTRERILLAGN